MDASKPFPNLILASRIYNTARMAWGGAGPFGWAEETMRAIFRTDRTGVSPVIATILLVAITVVLAAVMYVMVSGMFNPHATTAQFLGVSLGQSAGGVDWILTFVSVPNGLTQNDTLLTLRSFNGTTTFPATTLYILETATRGVQYLPSAYGPVTLAVGDRVVVASTNFPSGSQYLFLGSNAILASGTFQ